MTPRRGLPTELRHSVVLPLEGSRLEVDLAGLGGGEGGERGGSEAPGLDGLVPSASDENLDIS